MLSDWMLSNWSSLAYLESLAIKDQNPALNTGSNLQKIFLYSEITSDEDTTFENVTL